VFVSNFFNMFIFFNVYCKFSCLVGDSIHMKHYTLITTKEQS